MLSLCGVRPAFVLSVGGVEGGGWEGWGGVEGSEGAAVAVRQRECGNPLLIPSGFDSVELSECGLPYICFLLVAPSF